MKFDKTKLLDAIYNESDIGRYKHGRAEIRSFAKYVSKNLLEEYDVTIKK